MKKISSYKLFYLIAPVIALSFFCQEVDAASKPTISVDSKTASSVTLKVKYKKLKKKRVNIKILATGGDDNNTVMLLHGDEGNNLTTTHDTCKQPEQGRQIAMNGGSVTSTAQYKFGAGSLSFNGTTSYIATNDDDDWNFTGGIWTIDTWARVSDLSAERAVFSQATDADNVIEGKIATTGAVVLTIKANGTEALTLTTSTGAVTANNWHHIAFVENANEYAIYVDGVKSVLTSSTVRPGNYSGFFLIGYQDLSGDNDAFSGYLDEFRVSKGVARWANTFTLPTSAFGYQTVSTTSTKKLSSSGKATVKVENLLPNMEYSFKLKVRKSGKKKYTRYSSSASETTSN